MNQHGVLASVGYGTAF